MPHRNRVTPFGEIVALPERGTLMGNRGVLLGDDGSHRRDWQVRRWIACRLEFKGRRRAIRQPRPEPARAAERVTVLTPRATVGAIAGGYAVSAHPSAT